MITIKKNSKPDLTVCKMNCDKELHTKLNKYELTSYLNCHSTNLLIGKPRSGKTSMLYSLFKHKDLLRKCYHTIYLFQPSHSRVSMKDKIFDKLPDNQKIEELSYESLAIVLDEIKNAPSNENHCIIFDDMTAYLKNKDTLLLFKELIFNRRHLHTSIFMLVQSWYSVPKDIRKMWSNIFVFRVSKQEMEVIMDEVVEQKKDLALDIVKIVYDKPYNFLFINTDSGKLYRNFDELIFSNPTINNDDINI
jgi:GTPase SAR1 family protein